MTVDRDDTTPPERAPREDDLDAIVAGYVDRMIGGEHVLPEEILADHPDRGQEILDLLADFVELETRDTPALGTLGDYTLRRQIGRGGMGVVYDAWENSMDRRVALKVLPPGVAADERALQRFVREAKTAGQLSHPNIVSVYGMGLKEQTPYYAMELVDGETLAQVAAKLKEAHSEAPTPFGRKDAPSYFEQLARAFADVADGLQHAHARGVIHRDIKPSNLIIDHDGRLRILDFGLARLEGQESITVSGDLVGTVQYMSPEQARIKNIPVDHRTDVYSLGATMYELLTFRPPFKGKDHRDTLTQIIERDAQPLRKLNARVPRELETIVLKCLRKDPHDRFGTAEALAQDLRRFARGDPIEARPTSQWEIIIQRGRRHRWKVLIALVVTGLAAFVSVREFGAWQERRERTFAADLRAAATRLHYETILFHRAPGRLTRVRQEAWPYSRRPDDPNAPGTRVRFMQTLSVIDGLWRENAGRPEAAYHLAQALRRAGEVDRAGNVLEDALRTMPTSVPLRVLSAVHLAEAGREEAAALALRTAANIDPTGIAELHYEALRAEAKGDWQRAAGLFDDLLYRLRDRREPVLGLTTELRLQRMLALLEMGRLYEAALEVTRTATMDADVSASEMLLGLIHVLSGENDLAEAAFRRAIERAPAGEREVCAREASLFFASQWKFERAMSILELVGNALIRARQSAFLMARLGEWDAAAYERSVKEARQAVTLAPEDALSHAILGMALAGVKDAEGARAALARALEIGREDGRTCCLVAWAFSTLGDADAADIWDRESIRLSPSWTPSLVNLAMSCRCRGEYAEAINLLDRDIAFVPADFYAYIQRGAVRRLQGDLALALADFEEAERLQPAFALTALERGKLAAAMGDTDRAEESYRRALQHAQGDSGTETAAYRGLAELYLERDAPQTALRCLEDVLQRAPSDERTRRKAAELRESVARGRPRVDEGKADAGPPAQQRRE